MDEQLTNANTRCNNLRLEIDKLNAKNGRLKVQIREKLESVDVKNHVKTENEYGDEAVIETVVDVVVQNMISTIEIEKDCADMMKLNQKEKKDLSEKNRHLKAESKKLKKKLNGQIQNLKSESMKMKQKFNDQISMKNNTIEHLKRRIESHEEEVKSLEKKINGYKNREKVSEMINYPTGYLGYAPSLPDPNGILKAVDIRLQEKEAEFGETLKAIMTEMENMKKMNIEANERKSGDKDVLIKKRNTDGKKKKLHNVVKRDVNSDNSIQNDGKSKGRSYAAVTKSDNDVKFGKLDQRKIWKKKKSSDNVKPENNANPDNENQGEWIIVERKKKKGKSDKNGVVKVMKSRHGNYCVSMVIKKKKKEN